jgi:hypothetical protein
MLLAILSKRESQNSEDNSDDDRMFLLSLMPLMKQMSPQQKVKTRIELLQIVQNNLMSNATPDFPQYRQSTSCFGMPQPVVPTVQRGYNPVVAASSGPSTQAVQWHVPNYENLWFYPSHSSLSTSSSPTVHQNPNIGTTTIHSPSRSSD